MNSGRAAWHATHDWFHEKHPALIVVSLPQVAIASMLFICVSVLLATKLPLQYTWDAQDLLEGKSRAAYVANLVDARKLCITSADPSASCNTPERNSVLASDAYRKMKLRTRRAKLVGCRASFVNGVDTLPTDFLVCQSKENPAVGGWTVGGSAVTIGMVFVGFRLATRRPIWLRSTVPRYVRQLRVFVPTWCSVTLAATPMVLFFAVSSNRLGYNVGIGMQVLVVDFLLLMAILANFLVLDLKTSGPRERGFAGGLVAGSLTLAAAALAMLLLSYWLHANDVPGGTPIAVIVTLLAIVLTGRWLMRMLPEMRRTFIVTRKFVVRGCIMNAPLLIFFGVQASGLLDMSSGLWEWQGIPVWLLLCAALLAYCIWIETAMPWDRGAITTRVRPRTE